MKGRLDGKSRRSIFIVRLVRLNFSEIEVHVQYLKLYAPHSGMCQCVFQPIVDGISG